MLTRGLTVLGIRNHSHGVQCDFIFETDATTPGGHLAPGSRDAQLTSPSIASTSDAAGYPATWFSVFELELFHHFITSTSLTLASDPAARTFVS